MEQGPKESGKKVAPKAVAVGLAAVIAGGALDSAQAADTKNAQKRLTDAFMQLRQEQVVPAPQNKVVKEIPNSGGLTYRTQTPSAAPAHPTAKKLDTKPRHGNAYSEEERRENAKRDLSRKDRPSEGIFDSSI